MYNKKEIAMENMYMFDDEVREQRVLLCYHCGNKGLLNIVSKTRSAWEDTYMGELIHWETTDWTMLKCPVCQKVTLLSEHQEDGVTDQDGQDVTITEIVYPLNRTNFYNVPDNIRGAFESALKVQNIDPEICLLSLRRVLEAICKERGAKGNTLEQMIDDVIDKGILPETYRDACWIIRQLGNKAAHADTASSIYKNEVRRVIHFLDTMINYLYVLPSQINNLKEKVEREKEVPLF